MIEEDCAVQTLTELGLTNLQAKVYLALIKLCLATGRTTAEEARVASQDVYRVLSELQKIGLVRKIIAAPNKFAPIPLNEGLYMLIKRREEQTDELRSKTLKIIHDFQYCERSEEYYDENQFLLIPAKEPVCNKLLRNIETAQKSLDLSNDFRGAMEGFSAIHKAAMSALNRGVIIRNITEKPPQGCIMPEEYLILLEHPNFRGRYVALPPIAKLSLKDSKEALISTRLIPSTTRQPYLWTDNSILLGVIQNWYENIWSLGIDVKKEYRKIVNATP